MRFTYFRKHKLLFGLLSVAAVSCVIGGAVLYAYVHNKNNSDNLHTAVQGAATVKIEKSALLQLINAERAKVSVGSLASADMLDTAAVNRANDMIAKKYFDNTTVSPWGFVQQTGYKYQKLSTLIYQGVPGQTSSNDVVTVFINSTNKNDVLSSSYNSIGIGIVNGTVGDFPKTLVVIYMATPQTNSGYSSQSNASNIDLDPNKYAIPLDAGGTPTLPTIDVTTPSIPTPYKVQTPTVHEGVGGLCGDVLGGGYMYPCGSQ
jgi:uncharacterized protein YkwD